MDKRLNTRQQNAEKRVERDRERAAATRAARLALQRVLADKDATSEQILEAARLLVEIGK